ncbi:hypothetical protein [Clostridium oryzae]|uniref:ABC-2 family transporter protein n=1 Tax=Clostridium oryzae TaxID=1450648 RepID=A0A1V4IYC0_9CLOT|nr:hypothetical protein [Clostridium oryzae]OPJ64899.1 ABC-2 family transporter protein [Clostridium oryzae]
MKNKLFSTALLFDDMRNIIYSAAISMFVIILFSFGFFSQPNNYILRNYYPHSKHFQVFVDNTGVLFFVVSIAVITLLAFYNNKETKYGYVMAQPVSRDSFVVTKIIGLIISYTVPFIFYILISMILITMNTSFPSGIKFEAYKYVLLLVFITFCMTTFIVIFFQSMQLLFSNNISAIAMPAVMVACVAFEIASLYFSASPKIGFIRTFIDYLCNKLLGTPGDFGIIPAFMDFCSAHKIIGGIIFLLTAAIFLAINIMLNRKIKYENLSNIFTFKTLKNIFKAIVSLFIVMSLELLLLLLAFFIGYVTGINFDGFIEQSLRNHIFREFCEYLLLVINISWIPLTVLVYKLIGKIENRRRVA